MLHKNILKRIAPFLSRLMESKNNTPVSADAPGRRAA